MDASNQKKYEFDAVRAALLNNEAPFPPTMIYYFSDVAEDELALLKSVWPEVWVERRRGLLEDMESLAENDTLLYFDPIAVMCLEDADPVARATAIRLLWQSQKETLVPLLIRPLPQEP